jgi:Mg-chelatase subunit ChlD
MTEEREIFLSGSSHQTDGASQTSHSDDEKDLSAPYDPPMIEEDEEDEGKSQEEDLGYFHVENFFEVSRSVPRQRPQSAAAALTKKASSIRAITAGKVISKNSYEETPMKSMQKYRPQSAPSERHVIPRPMRDLTRVRDYSVLVDASSSMRTIDRDARGKTRWQLAKEALECLVPQVVERDDDGISLYFFSTGYQKFTNVNCNEHVRTYFTRTQPKGGTQLTEALADAIIPDNIGRPETILIITDGTPENRRSVEVLIQNAANALVNSDDLRIVFVQVGNDASAARWLSNLDSDLKCKFDIVDTISSDQLVRKGVPFAQWVARSVMPDLMFNQGPSAKVQSR